MPISPLGCDEEYAPVFWLGKPCTLTQIKMPDRDYSRTGGDHFTEHDLLDGIAASRGLHYRRSWNMQYSWLHPDAASILMEYVTRQRGIGPFVFIDPHIKNVLTPNQASGTDALVDTEGFSVSGSGEELSSSDDWAAQGVRSLLWTFSLPVTGGGILTLDSPTGLYGWASPAGQDWAFSGVLRSANEAGLTVQPRLVYLSNTGGIVGSVTGNSLSVVSGSSMDFCLTGEIAANACYVEPQILVSGASVDEIMYDTFARTVAAGGWGSANTGQAWTVDGTASRYSVGSGVGQISVNARNTNFRARLASKSFTDLDYRLGVSIPVVPTVDYFRYEMMFRFVDANNFYALRVHIHPASTIEVQIKRILAGVETTLDALVLEPTTFSAGVMLRNRIEMIGSRINTKIWRNDEEEPADWSSTTVDTAIAAGHVGLNAFIHPSNTNALPVIFSYDDLIAVSVPLPGLYLDQLQLEMNDECTDWEYGQGQPLVSVRADNEVVPRVRRTTLSFALTEVTP
jgi:hypothetical protein